MRAFIHVREKTIMSNDHMLNISLFHLWSFFHPGICRTQSSASGSRSRKRDQGSPAAWTKDCTPIAAGAPPVPGSFSKKIKDATEFALFELDRIARDGITPDDGHRFELWS
jgi:hypothetical protein